MSRAKIIELDETNTCKICDNALAKYSCPKCNIIYCSLTCYQSEGHLECSEEFYKANVMQELKLDPNSSESKAKMMEILNRAHECNRLPSGFLDDSSNLEDLTNDFDLDDLSKFSQFVDIDDLDEELDSDDDEFVDLAERLAGVDLDNADTVWDKLTEDEKQDFVAFLKKEDLTKYLPNWDPWWSYTEKNKVVDVEKLESVKKNCPKVGDIKSFCTISTKTPAPSVKYNLINILASYAFMVRYFNGEHQDLAKEAVTTLATVSTTLKKGQNFESFEIAVKSVEQECINCEWILTDSENLDLMRDDLKTILEGPSESENKFYILCALSDLQELFRKALKPQTTEESGSSSFERQFPNNQLPNIQLETPNRIKNYVKRVDYFLSYTKELLQL